MIGATENRPLQIAIGLSLALHLGLSWALADRLIVHAPVLPSAPPLSVRVVATSSVPVPVPAHAPTPVTPEVEPEVVQPPRANDRPAPRPTPPPTPLPRPKAISQPPPPRSPEPPLPESPPVDATTTSMPPATRALAAVPTAASNPAPATEDEDGLEEELLARYVAEIRRRVGETRRYPSMARRRAIEGRVMARIEIRADGSLGRIELGRDAPRLLQRATQEAIRRAAPYPPPPRGAIAFELPVDYSLLDAS